MSKFTCLLTPGRSGSTFFQHVFNLIDNAFAEESYFMCTDHPSQCYSTVYGKSEADKIAFTKSKIDYIENLDCDYYLDSVSLTCQDNNLDRFIELGYHPNVVTLRRDPRDVALSWYRLNWSPVESPMTSVKPTDKDSIKIGLANPHDYQYCLWYCFEIERLSRAYKPKLEAWGIKHYETSLSRIVDKDNFNTMLDYFDLPNIDRIYEEKINELSDIKVRDLDASLMHDLQDEFLENIKLNNDLEASLLDMDRWTV